MNPSQSTGAGRSPVRPIVCPHCGHLILGGRRFCLECGYDVLADRLTREDGSPQHWMTAYRPFPTRQAVPGPTLSALTRRRLVVAGFGTAVAGMGGGAFLVGWVDRHDGERKDGAGSATPEAETRNP